MLHKNCGWALACALFAPVQCALAAVQIEAPPAVAELLRRYLLVAAQDIDSSDPLARANFLREARREAGNLLAAEGYFSPTLQLGAGLRPVLKVEPGERAHIASVRIEFSGAIAARASAQPERMERLRKAWLLPAGAAFRQLSWDEAKDALLADLTSLDFPAAAYTLTRAEVDPAAASVEILVEVDSGPAFRFGRTEIEGVKEYPAGLPQRYGSIAPGSRYSRERLLDLQRALQNTPYFSTALVDIDTDPAQSEAATVHVRVVESTARHISFGAGYSSNNGARGEISYRQPNLFGRAWNLQSTLRLEMRHQLAFTDVLLPPAAGGFRDGYGALAESTDSNGLDTRRVKLGWLRTRTLGALETSYGLSLQRELHDVTDGDYTRRDALAANASWTWRSVDNLLDPRSGQVINLQLGGGLKLLASDQNFVRGYVRYQRYQPVGARDTLMLRGELGMTRAASSDGIPEEFLFRAGGTGSIRGYAYQSLGPREAGAVVGGRLLAIASVEYVHWLQGDWGVAGFVDSGNAVDRRGDFVARTGYGVGLRWKSPAGPLAFDLAYSRHEQKLRPHVAVAIAF
ncbi:MAG: BamA/TamA family outer membrane protein [Rhodocyclaceae bacterium]|nr:BamA/TamA family outer membrane protein [Rhodocyclaceae bacterium]MBX3669300.1 BamA/TamA family outer membrane protein [Rhodocyclaceae bacterium]